MFPFKIIKTHQSWLLLGVTTIIYLAIMKIIPGSSGGGQLLHIAPLTASVSSTLVTFLLFICSKNFKKYTRENSGFVMWIAFMAVGFVLLNQAFLYTTRNAIEHRVLQVMVSYLFAVIVSVTPLLLNGNARRSHKIILYSILTVVGLVSVWAALKSNWYHLNPDGVSYYSIAEHYASGSFNEAINAYWSPLISWLLAPFIFIGLEANTAYRMIAAGVGGLIVLGVGVLLRRTLPKKAKLTQPLTYSAIVVTSLFCLSVVHSGLITPDLLTVAWTVWLCVLWDNISRQNRLNRDRWLMWAVFFGIYGAIGFYIKGFLLPFYVLTLVFILFSEHWFNHLPRIHALKVSLVTFSVLTVLIAPWVGALKYKYGTWMTGSSSKYNISWIGPSSVKHPIRNQILEPPHDRAVGAWEDPTNHPYIAWSPTRSLEDLQFHIFVNTEKNVKNIIGFLNSWTFASSVTIVIGLTMLFLMKRGAELSDRRMFVAGFLSLLSVVYAAGYAVVHVVGGDRYLWPVLVINIIIFVIIISRLLENIKNKQILAVWFFCSLVVVQFVGLYTTSALKKHIRLNDNDHYYSLAESISDYVPKDSRVVANSLIPGFYVAYKLDLKYYGVVAQNLNETVSRDLAVHNIDFFFCLNTQSNCGFSGDMLVWESKNRLNKVYKVN